MNGWDELDELLFGRIGRARFDEDLTTMPPGISVTKLGAQVPVSTDMLMAEGLIPDTRPARPRQAPVRVTSWTLARDLTRVRVRGTITAGRLRAGSWIAGTDLTERDEDEEW